METSAVTTAISELAANAPVYGAAVIGAVVAFHGIKIAVRMIRGV